jgi:hypothetical protein
MDSDALNDIYRTGLVPGPSSGPKISKTVCFKSQTNYFPLIKITTFRKNIGSLKRKDANSAQKNYC